MIVKKIVVLNKLGLHARPASLLVQETHKFGSEIYLEAVDGGVDVDAKSLMGILMLAAVEGTELLLKVDGDDEEEAMEAIVKLFENKFGEE